MNIVYSRASLWRGVCVTSVSLPSGPMSKCCSLWKPGPALMMVSLPSCWLSPKGDQLSDA